MPWVRFVSEIRFVRGIVEALQLAVGSFRRRNSVRSERWSRRYSLSWVRFAVACGNGFVSSRRYSLPWVRFVSGIRFVRESIEALQITVGSFRQQNSVRSGEMVEALHLAVGSFRQRNSVRSGKPTRRYSLPWVRFVSGIRFVRGDRPGVTACRGFVSRDVLLGFLRGMRTNLGCHGFSEPVPQGPL